MLESDPIGNNSIGNEPKGRVELSFKIVGLKSTDYFSASDPIVFLYEKKIDGDEWVKIGSTEMIKNASNPVFKTRIVLDYFFERKQELRASIFDVDNKNKHVNESHDTQGDCFFTLGEIIGSKNSTIAKGIYLNKVKHGTLVVYGENLICNKSNIFFNISASNLDKKDFFGSSDPYLVISRIRQDGSAVNIYKTETIKKNLNPQWKTFTLSSENLQNNDINNKIRIECFDWDNNSKHDLIGLVELTFNLLKPSASFTLLSSKGKSAGTIHFNEFVIIPQYSFLEYTGNFEFSTCFAIDFTASNGEANYNDSLHYRNPNEPNQYQQAIVNIGEIVKHYDSDKLFPVLGFGGMFMKSGYTSDCFYLNNHKTNPEVNGIQGILDAYQNANLNTILSGPTHFNKVITFINDLAINKLNTRCYHILVIITDGIINDMTETKQAIKKASSLPISIIIIGVGNANFSLMNELDGDDNGKIFIFLFFFTFIFFFFLFFHFFFPKKLLFFFLKILKSNDNSRCGAVCSI